MRPCLFQYYIKLLYSVSSYLLSFSLEQIPNILFLSLQVSVCLRSPTISYPSRSQSLSCSNSTTHHKSITPYFLKCFIYLISRTSSSEPQFLWVFSNLVDCFILGCFAGSVKKLFWTCKMVRNILFTTVAREVNALGEGNSAQLWIQPRQLRICSQRAEWEGSVDRNY